MSKQTTAGKKQKQPRIFVDFSKSRWDANVNVWIGGKKPRKEHVDAGWFAPDEYRDPDWGAEIITEPTCCSFEILGDFKSEDRSRITEHAQRIGAILGKKIKKSKRVYLVAYVPDTKEYEAEHLILEAAGFKRGITLKSLHGNYTNTRWEWFASQAKAKEYAKAVSTFAI